MALLKKPSEKPSVSWQEALAAAFEKAQKTLQRTYFGATNYHQLGDCVSEKFKEGLENPKKWEYAHHLYTTGQHKKFNQYVQKTVIHEMRTELKKLANFRKLTKTHATPDDFPDTNDEAVPGENLASVYELLLTAETWIRKVCRHDEAAFYLWVGKQGPRNQPANEAWEKFVEEQHAISNEDGGEAVSLSTTRNTLNQKFLRYKKSIAKRAQTFFKDSQN